MPQYTVTWVDGDGNTLKTDQLDEGTTPVYSGKTPTKTATPQYTYTFNNTWSPAIVPVTANFLVKPYDNVSAKYAFSVPPLAAF